MNFFETIQKLVDESDIKIDKPKNSVHPRYSDYIYPFDYGYLEGTSSNDGDGIDCWIGSIGGKQVTHIVVVADRVKKDSEIKILLGCTDRDAQTIIKCHQRGQTQAKLIPFDTDEVFDLWNLQKQSIDYKKHFIYFNEREIWFIRAGKNIGYEEDGKGEDFVRPVLIVKKFNKRLFWGVFLSTTQKRGKFYHELDETITVGRKSVVILSQFRLLDAKRLHNKVIRLNKTEFADVVSKLVNIFPKS